MFDCTLTIAIVVVLVLLAIFAACRYASEGFLVPDPIITTYGQYLTENGPPIVVGLHHTNWCGYCKQMMPIWERVKADLAGQNIKFVEFDEDKVHTPWVDGYPTIVKVNRLGKSSKYQGRAVYEDLKAFVLNAAQ